MKILSLDSSTSSATCAIIEDGKMLGEVTFNYKKQHSVLLMSMIDSLLSNLELTVNDLDGFAVSSGPGSFTGLRIGIATIKGLSQGSGKPFIGVSSLDALAFNMAYTSGIVCPIIDALRGNVYTALYRFEGTNFNKLTENLILPLDELIELLKGKNETVCFIGDASTIYREEIQKKFDHSMFAPAHLNVVKASSLGELGLNMLEHGEKSDLLSFAPSYMRKSQAEREYDRKMEKSNE